MLLFIFSLLVAIVGLIVLGLSHNNFLDVIGGVLFGAGGIAAFIMILLIVLAHVGIDAQIEENRIEYEALRERQEIVDSEYEDVSKSDVIKEISEWNKNVYSCKYWANNPWTSWFYSKRVADDMKMIEMEGREE